MPTVPTADHARRIDDLGRIILAYSDVTLKLQQSHDQLTQTVQALRQELGEKNRQLERSNRLAALGEMAAGLAHEIRNPLGGIQLYASMLAKDVSDRPASLATVHKITGGVKRLDGLVNQVLRFSRDVSATRTDVDLIEIIQQAMEFARPQCDAGAVDCELIGPENLPVSVDAALIGQALLNVILNAVEASNTGGKVTITAEAGRPFRLTVVDTGPGIPPAALDRIFNPFFTTKETGTGLGLAIVHRIVEAHDGVITASNPAGGGAKFEIRI